MTLRQTDPLLAIATGIVLFAQAALSLAAAALLVALPIVALFPDAITVRLRAELADPTFVFPVLLVVGLMLFALVIAVLVFLFLENLRRIVRTVGEGDPFMPINAQRLTAMAWLMLAVELITIPMAALGLRLLQILDPTGGGRDEFSIDFSGLILVVTLFILARVFRRGAEMRADLEGTI